MDIYRFSSTVVQYNKIPRLTCLQKTICIGEIGLHGVLTRGVLKHLESSASSYRSSCGMVWNIAFGWIVHWSLSLLLWSVSLQTENFFTVPRCFFFSPVCWTPTELLIVPIGRLFSNNCSANYKLLLLWRNACMCWLNFF